MPKIIDSQTYGSGASLVSPTLTGTPTAPTAPPGTSTTQLATTAFVLANTNLSDPLSPLLTAPVAITGALTLTAANFGRMHVCSGTSANYAVTLPSPTGNAGKFLSFVMASSLTKLVTLTPSSTETIDGATTRVMWANESATLFCDGTNWIKVAGKSIPMVANMYLGSGTVSLPNGQTPIPTKSVLTDNTGLMADTANGWVNILRSSSYFTAAFTTVNNSSPGYTGGAASAVMLDAGTALSSGLFYFTGASYPTAGGSGIVTTGPGHHIQSALYQSTGQTLVTVGTAASQNYISVLEIISW